MKKLAQCHIEKKFRNSQTAMLSIFLATILLISTFTPSYGLQQNVVQKSIQNISKTIVGSHTIIYKFQFCSLNENRGTTGVLLSTDALSVPVLINNKIKLDKCQTYGAKLLIDKSSSVQSSLFTQKDISKIIQQLETKKSLLERELVLAEQQLQLLYLKSSVDAISKDRIQEQIEKIGFLKDLVASTKKSLIDLRALAK